MQLLTKRQLLTILFMYGYTAGSVPRKSDVGADVVLLHIPPSYRSGSHTRAQVEIGPKNGQGHQLYKLTFIA